MTIPAWRNPQTDVLEPIQGNPAIRDLANTRKARLSVIMHESWTWEERWTFGVYNLRIAIIPEGFRIVSMAYEFDDVAKEVVEVPTTEPVVNITTGRIGDRNARPSVERTAV